MRFCSLKVQNLVIIRALTVTPFLFSKNLCRKIDDTNSLKRTQIRI